jgi:hypothetical protein
VIPIEVLDLKIEKGSKRIKKRKPKQPIGQYFANGYFPCKGTITLKIPRKSR